jgi:molecular chaperone GrpE
MEEHEKKPEPFPEAGDDLGRGPHDVEARLRALEAELDNARQAARQHEDRWLRERAEVDNFKKRVARERAEHLRFANEAVLKDLLPVVDNLERAVEHARGGGDGQPLVDGVALVLKGLLDVLERHGVTRVEARGTPFDPAHHEAMAHVETDAHPPNTVVEEHQPGYRLHDRLLRPALVSVAKPPDNLVKS